MVFNPTKGRAMNVQSKFNTAWESTLAKMPRDVRGSLEKYWANLPAAEVDGEHHAAPYAVLGKGWTEQTGLLASCLNEGGWFVFDLDFISTAPAKIVETLMAHEIAHVYQNAKDGKNALPAGDDSEKEVAAYLAAWGSCDSDIEFWIAAQRLKQ